LIIAGSAKDPKYAKQVYDYIDSYKMGESVVLAGLLNQENLSRAYADASIVCLFSLQENMPIVIAQAMAAGKPVVASSVGGIPDLVVNGETGFLVDVGDEKNFAKRIIELLSDSLLRRRMGERGREIANELFRKEIVARKTLEVYRVAIQQES
jgi:glycosyltransferase involved in cell wall biosynthesis